jgi:hypothetical protein
MTDYITSKDRIGKREVSVAEDLLLALIIVATISLSIYALTY